MLRKKSTILLILIVGSVLWFFQSDARKGSASPPNTTGIENPLLPCPNRPNCVRASRLFEEDSATLFTRARAAVEAIGGGEIQVDEKAQTVQAVFDVVIFKDDFSLVVVPHLSGSVLHLRSASRTGYSDWGKNGKRADQFWATLG